MSNLILSTSMSIFRKIFDFLAPKILLSMNEETLLRKCYEFQSTYRCIFRCNRTKFSLQFFNVFLLILPEIWIIWGVHRSPILKDITTKFEVLVLERDIIAVYEVNLLFSQHPSKSETSTEYRSWQNYLRNSTASTGQYLLKHSSLIAIEN